MKPIYSATLCSLAAAAAFASGSATAQDDEHKAAMVDKAIAVIHPTEGNDVKGVVMFTKDGDTVTVNGRIVGLTPGKHGFHIHQFGDIRAADGTSAGGHFNPDGKEHGGPDDEQRHVGDLGNIEANDDGVAEFKVTDMVLALDGAHSILGRSVVVHAGADDLKSQPSGDAGPRVGVGVIGVANPEAGGQ